MDAGETLTLSTDTLDGVTLSGGTDDVSASPSARPARSRTLRCPAAPSRWTAGQTLTLSTDTLDGVTLSGGTDDVTAVTIGASGEIENATVSGGTITVDAGETLTLSTDTLDGVTLTGGTDDVTAVTIGASGAIENATVSGGTITVDTGVALTLDDVTVDNTTITNATSTAIVSINDTVTVEGDTAMTGGTIENYGATTAESGSTLTLTGDLINETNATLEALSNATIDLNPAGGGNYGTIEADGNNSNINLTAGGGGNGAGNVDMIEAVNGGEVTITGDGFLNPGTVEAGAGGDVTIENVEVDNTGGTIEALGLNSIVQITDADIQGGTLLTGAVIMDGSGNTISVDAGGGDNTTVLDGSTHAVTIAGDVADFGSNLELVGTIHVDGNIDDDDYGQIQVGSPGNTGGSLVIDGTVTLNSLDGGGQISLWSSIGDAVQIVAASAGAALDNYDTIYGSGQIGADDTNLTVTNEVGATIEASTATINNVAITGTLTIDTGATFTNLGTLEAAAGATLQIDDSVSNSGTIELNGAGAAVVFSNDDVTNTSTISADGSVSFDGATVTNNGTIETADTTAVVQLSGATITGGAITNNGTIEVTGSSTINGSAALTGGQVTIASSQELTLDGTTVTGTTITDLGTTTTTGTVNVDSGKMLTLAGSDTITGGLFAILIGPVQAAANGSVLFPEISIGDLNPGDPSVTVTIQASSGSFAAISGSGLTVNQNGDVITITGDLTDVNNALNDGITYTPVGSANTLTLSVTDGSGDTAFRALGINTSNPASPTTTNASASGEITNAGLIDVTGTTTLSSDALFNTGATVKIETGELLKLDDTKIYNGTITDNGIVEIAGASAIVNASLNIGAGGQLTIDPAAALFLSGATITGTAGATINDGTDVSGGAINVVSSSAIKGASLNNGGVTIASGQTLTLDNDTVTATAFTDTASGAILSVDHGNTLTLSGVTIDGGAIDDGTGASGATITISTASEIENASLNYGGVTVASGVTLTLDNDAVTGTTFTDTATGTVLPILSVADADTLSGATIDGGTVTLAADATLTGSGSSEIENATINMASSSELVTGGAFTLDDDTVNGGIITGAHNGQQNTIDVDSGATLTLDGVTVEGGGGGHATTDNSGAITLVGTLTLTGETGSPTFTLLLDNNGTEGTGTVSLGGATIEATTAGATFENNGNTISGIGQIGDGTTTNLTLDNNAGTIEALGGMLTIETGNTITNASGATLEAASAAKLKIDDSTIDNSGNIQVDGTLVLGVPSAASSTLTLDGAGTVTLAGGAIVPASLSSGETLVNDGNTIIGYGTIGNFGSSGLGLTVDNDASGTIEASGGTLKIATGAPFTNDGLLEVASGGTLDFTLSALANNGTNPLGATDPNGILIYGTFLVDNPTTSTSSVTLNGSPGQGGVALVGGTIEGNSTNSETFFNANNVIAGYGSIGIGTDELTLDNETHGTIDANVSGQTLTLDPAGTITNAGLLEATNGGTLQVDSATIDNTGNIKVGSGASLLAIPNGGSLTLDGGGTVTLAGGAIGVTGTASLTNAGNTIIGYGSIGLGNPNTLNLDNEEGATIEASGSGDTLVLKTHSAITNAGTLEAASGATLQINVGTIDNTGNIQVDGTLTLDRPSADGNTQTLDDDTGTVTLAGGTIDGAISGDTLVNNGNAISGFGQIGGTGSALALNNSAGTIDALGVLTIETGQTVLNSGTMEAGGSAPGTLQIDDAVTNSGTIQALSGGALVFDGNTIGNTDTIALAAGTPGTPTTLIVEGSVTLDDAGSFTLASDSQIVSYLSPPPATTAPTTLINSGNTISGGGTSLAPATIGDQYMTVDNDAGGTIDATGVLTLNPVALNNNGGLLEASAGGTLQIFGLPGIGEAVGNSGSIEDYGTISFDNATLTDTGSGGITVETSGAILDLENGATVSSGTITDTVGGAINVSGTATLEDGATIDGGTVTNNDTLDISGTVTLESGAAVGGGIVADSGTLDISGTVTLGGGVTVSGTGTIADNGTLEANGGAFTVDSGVTINGTGSVLITNGGTAGFQDAFDQNVTFSGSGTLELAQPSSFDTSHAISGFGSGDTIDLTDIGYSATETDVWNSTNDTLTINNGTSTATLTFAGGPYTQSDFALTNDGSGPNAGTDIVWSPAQASLSPLDSAGNAVDGYAVTASLTGETATSYTWLENGQIVQSSSNASFIPGQTSDAGDTLNVVIGFTDNGIPEQITELAGTVVAPPEASFGTTPNPRFDGREHGVDPTNVKHILRRCWRRSHHGNAR